MVTKEVSIKEDRWGIPHYGRGKPDECSEYKLQKATASYLSRFDRFDALHPPNERSNRPTVKQLAELKRAGVVFGAADWIFFLPQVAFIELKVKGGKLTDNEKVFLLDKKKKGFPVFVCWSFDAFHYVVQKEL